MAIFENIVKGLNNFNANAWDYVVEELRQNEEAITSINTLRIFETGTDGEGKKISNKYASYPVYSEAYTRKKKRLGLYNGHVNLFLSGNYLGSYGLEVSDKEVFVNVDPSQADLDQVLEDMYGLDIKGLTEKEWGQAVVEFILPRVLDEFLKAFV
jgi:hypothetical protein